MDSAFDYRDTAIALGSMPQRTEVRGPGDDWTGVTSTAARRKLQNRLNQRAYRRRKLGLRDRPAVPESANTAGIVSYERRETPLSEQLPRVTDEKDRPSDNTPTRCAYDLGSPSRQTMFRRFAQEALAEYVGGAPRPTRLPTLVQLNVFSALTRNAAALGVSKEWLADDTISPFSRHGPDLGLFFPGMASSVPYPDSLRPTALQVAVPHHPWIDLLPIPRLRDNILCATVEPDALDEDDLCYDLVEVTGESDKASLIVWAEPWNPRGWEVSVAFLRKWGWLLKGCPEILEATNYWREKRGEKRLAFTLQC